MSALPVLCSSCGADLPVPTPLHVCLCMCAMRRTRSSYLLLCFYVCMYVGKDPAAPAHARTRAHRPATPCQSSDVSNRPACPERVASLAAPPPASECSPGPPPCAQSGAKVSFLCDAQVSFLRGSTSFCVGLTPKPRVDPSFCVGVTPKPRYMNALLDSFPAHIRVPKSASWGIRVPVSG